MRGSESVKKLTAGQHQRLVTMRQSACDVLAGSLARVTLERLQRVSGTNQSFVIYSKPFARHLYRFQSGIVKIPTRADPSNSSAANFVRAFSYGISTKGTIRIQRGNSEWRTRRLGTGRRSSR